MDSAWRDILALLSLVLLFGAAIFLAAAETSLVRVSRVRIAVLADEGDRRARRLGPLIYRLPRVLNAVLFAALLVQIGAATLTGYLVQRHFGNVGVTIGSIVLTVLLFVYAEVIPKTYAVRRPDEVALRLAMPVLQIERVLRPVIAVLVWFADLQTPWRSRPIPPTVTESELRMLAAQAAREGEISSADRELVERGFRFGDATAARIMVPLARVVAVSAKTPVADALEAALEHGHRRLPVFETRPEEIHGIVRLRDLAAQAQVRPNEPVSALVRSAMITDDAARIVDILRRMQVQGKQMAVVRRGKRTVGILTIEDIVEELVGDIEDHAPTGRQRRRRRARRR